MKNIINVTFEERQFGDLVVIQAPPGWSVPVGWTRLQSADENVFAYWFMSDLFRSLPEGIDRVRVYRGLEPAGCDLSTVAAVVSAAHSPYL